MSVNGGRGFGHLPNGGFEAQPYATFCFLFNGLLLIIYSSSVPAVDMAVNMATQGCQDVQVGALLMHYQISAIPASKSVKLTFTHHYSSQMVIANPSSTTRGQDITKSYKGNLIGLFSFFVL